jgi:hypothetical protein
VAPQHFDPVCLREPLVQLEFDLFEAFRFSDLLALALRRRFAREEVGEFG